MTPKEKAQELYFIFSQEVRGMFFKKFRTKRCALIAVDEMINLNGDLYLNSLGDITVQYYKAKNNYLFEVKQEIEKL